MPSLSNAIEKAAGLATGVILLAIGGGSAPAVAGAGAIVAGAGLAGALSDLLDGKSTDIKSIIDSIRFKTFVKLGNYHNRIEFESANAALIDAIPSCLPDISDLASAAFEPTGFFEHATNLILNNLAAKRPDIFSDLNSRAYIYAKAIIHTSLTTAIESPEYFSLINPHITIIQSKHFESLRLGISQISDTTNSIKSDTSEILIGMKELLSREGAKYAQDAGLSKAQVEAILIRFGHENVPIERAESLLVRAADDFKDLRIQLRRLNNDDPEIAALRTKALSAIESADFQAAKHLLIEASKLDDSYVDELEKRSKERRISSSNSLSEAARLSAMQADFLEAADLFCAAAARIEPIDKNAAWELRLLESRAAYDHGELFPGKNSLLRAITIRKSLLSERISKDDEAFVKLNLANTLGILGDRTPGKQGLEYLYESIDILSSVCDIYRTGNRAFEWAGVKSNIGNVWESIADRESGLAAGNAIKNSVQSHRDALSVYSNGNFLEQRAETQINLAISLLTFGGRLSREDGLVAFKDAMTACGDAISVFTKDINPEKYYKIKKLMGAILRAVGIRKAGSERIRLLNRSVKQFREALSDANDTPGSLSWTDTRSGIARSQFALSDLVPEDIAIPLIEQAIGHLSSVLAVNTRDKMLISWAAHTHDMSVALYMLSKIDRDIFRLSKAIESMKEIIPIFNDQYAAYHGERARRDLILMQSLFQEITSQENQA